MSTTEERIAWAKRWRDIGHSEDPTVSLMKYAKLPEYAKAAAGRLCGAAQCGCGGSGMLRGSTPMLDHRCMVMVRVALALTSFDPRLEVPS